MRNTCYHRHQPRPVDADDTQLCSWRARTRLCHVLLLPRNYDETVQEATNGLHFLLCVQWEGVISLQPYDLLVLLGNCTEHSVLNRNVYWTKPTTAKEPLNNLQITVFMRYLHQTVLRQHKFATYEYSVRHLGIFSLIKIRFHSIYVAPTTYSAQKSRHTMFAHKSRVSYPVTQKLLTIRLRQFYKSMQCTSQLSWYVTDHYNVNEYD